MKGGKTALYEGLKRQILTLQLPPDSDLDEARLSEEYGISRTPVRDVFRQLAGEGFVDIRENRGARVIPMDHASLRDFFRVAPLVYEAVARLAVHNFRSVQLTALEACQDRFRAAMAAGDAEAMALENTAFHAQIGDMAHSVYLQPSLNRLLIDHARIGHTFFRPADAAAEADLAASSAHHDAFVAAIAARDQAAVVALVHDHWALCRGNMAAFVAPRPLPSEALRALSVDEIVHSENTIRLTGSRPGGTVGGR